MPKARPENRTLVLAAVLLVAACSGGSSGPAGPALTATDNVIQLDLTAALQISQGGTKVSAIQVKRGQTYTFRITNTAGFAHDFQIGTDADLSAAKAGLPGLAQFSNGTQEFSYTFDTGGPLMFGCTVPGHYASMKGTFDIQP
ncbi:MAG: plastocyanin/azurin family copper-binding protein [Candidatus Limnocylindrales bacterium]